MNAAFGPPTAGADCNVAIGEIHELNCDVARCSMCKGQRLSCACLEEETAPERWSGYWPGSAECLARGWMLTKNFPDLNRWTAFALTGKDLGPNAGHHPLPPFEVGSR